MGVWNLRSQFKTRQGQVLNTKEIYFPTGSGGRDKGQRQEIEIENKGREQRRGRKGARKRGRGVCPVGTNDCLWTVKTVVYEGKMGNPRLG